MPKSMLVADDSRIIQKAIAITFAHQDYQISFASSGADALTKARQTKPDIILADTNMPQPSGLDLCKTIKGDPSLRDIPVILMAGIHEGMDDAKASAVGAISCILKPFESQALLDRVSQVTLTKPDAHLSSAQNIPTPAASPAATVAKSSPRDLDQPTFDQSSPMTFDFTSDTREALLDNPETEALAFASEESDFSFDLSSPKGLTIPSSESTEPFPKSNFATATFDLDPPLQAANVAQAYNNAGSSEVMLTEVPAVEDDLWEFGGELKNAPAPVDIDVDDAYGDASLADPSVDFSAAALEVSADSDTGMVPDFDLAMPAIDIASPEPEDFSFASASLPDHPVQQTYQNDLPTSPQPQKQPTSSATAALSLTPDQIESIVTKAFRNVIEQIAWEVVPEMAEKIIRQELARLTKA